MHSKITTIWTFLILICYSVYGQSIEDVVKYVESQSGYRITSYSTNVHGNYQNKDPKLLTDITIQGALISNLQVLDTFPDLTFLRILKCTVDTMYNIPASVRTLLIDFGQVNSVINIPPTVERLIFWDNKTDLLPILPNTLIELKICDNNFSKIEKLPDSLKIFDCSENQFTILPNLPAVLEILRCEKNNIQSLPDLPKYLKTLNCSFNNLNELGRLPNRLEKLYCRANQITNIKILPDNLRELDLVDNPIKKLPKISKNCQLRISPTYLNKENDYRHLLLECGAKYPNELENISQRIYKSFIDYDFNTFTSYSISLKDFYWLFPLMEGDSVSKMKELTKLIKEDIKSQERKDEFLAIANDIDNGLLLLDSVEILEIDSEDIPPYKTYKSKFYFKKVGYDISQKYLTVDIIDSPNGYLWTSFFSNLRDVTFEKNTTSYKNPLPENIPDDFEITVSCGHDYRFNSEQGVFIKGMTCNRAIAQVDLTLKEKEKLFTILKAIGFNELKEDMVQIRDSHFPPTTISIFCNGIMQTVNYNCLNDCDTYEYKKLKEFMDTMNQILYKKRKVKKLPKTAFMYI